MSFLIVSTNTVGAARSIPWCCMAAGLHCRQSPVGYQGLAHGANRLLRHLVVSLLRSQRRGGAVGGACQRFLAVPEHAAGGFDAGGVESGGVAVDRSWSRLWDSALINIEELGRAIERRRLIFVPDFGNSGSHESICSYCPCL